MAFKWQLNTDMNLDQDRMFHGVWPFVLLLWIVKNAENTDEWMGALGKHGRLDIELFDRHNEFYL